MAEPDFAAMGIPLSRVEDAATPSEIPTEPSLIGLTANDVVEVQEPPLAPVREPEETREEPQVSEARSLFERITASTTKAPSPSAEAARAEEVAYLRGVLSQALQASTTSERLDRASEPPKTFEQELSEPGIAQGFKRLIEENPAALPVALGRIVEHYGSRLVAQEVAPLREQLAEQTRLADTRRVGSRVVSNFNTAARYIAERGTDMEKEVLRDFAERKEESILAQMVSQNPLYTASPDGMISAVFAAAAWVEEAGRGVSPETSVPVSHRRGGRTQPSTGPSVGASNRSVSARGPGKGERDYGAEILNARSRAMVALPFLNP